MTHNRELLLRAAAAGWARLPCLFSLVPVVFAAALSDAGTTIDAIFQVQRWGKFLAAIKNCHPLRASSGPTPEVNVELARRMPGGVTDHEITRDRKIVR